MSNAHYEIVESLATSKKPRRVSLHAPEKTGTVCIKVNGVVVAAFREGDDHLELYAAQTEITGLAAWGSGGLLRVQ